MLVVHAASSPMTLSLFVDNSSRHCAVAGVRFLYLAGNERVSGQLRGETLKVTLPRGYLFSWHGFPVGSHSKKCWRLALMLFMFILLRRHWGSCGC